MSFEPEDFIFRLRGAHKLLAQFPHKRIHYRLSAGLIVAILLLALGLRLYRLAHQSLWLDEVITLRRAGLALPAILEDLPEDQSPLYYILMHFWLGAFGTSDFALRLPSALLSGLTLALIYRLVRDLFNREVAIWTAGIVALNPFHLWYSQEARNYSLLLSLSLASVVLFIRALQKGHWRLWLAYASITAACLYTHYFALLVIGLEALFLLFSWLIGRYRTLVGRWLASQALIGLSYSLWLPSALRLSQHRLGREAFSVLPIPGHLLAIYSLGNIIPTHSIGDYVNKAQGTSPFLWGFALLLLIGLLAIFRQEVKLEARLLALCYLIVPILVISFLMLTGRGFKDRYLIPIIPGYYLFLGLGLWGMRRAWWPLCLAGALFVGGMSVLSTNRYFFDPFSARPDYKTAAAYIETHAKPGDAILSLDDIGPQSPFPHYYQGTWPIYYNFAFAHHETGSVSPAELTSLISQHRRWWVLSYSFDYIESILINKYYLVDCQDFSSVLVCLFSAPEKEAVLRQQPASARSNGEISLAAYRLFPNPIPSGQIANLSLFWKVNEPVKGDYKLSLRLKDEKGFLLSQIDRPPLAGLAPTSGWKPSTEVEDHYGLLLPSGLLPGSYQIEIVLYNPSSGQELAWAELDPLEVARPETPLPPEKVEIQHRKEIELSTSLKILGYEGLDSHLQAGRKTAFTLFWHTEEKPKDNWKVLLELKDKEGKVWGRTEETHESYPMGLWEPGDIWQVRYEISPDPASPPGKYLLLVNLLDERGKMLFSEGKLLSTVEVKARPHSYARPHIEHPIEANFGKEALFLGYDLKETVVRPGEAVHLTLYWQAEGPMSGDYTVFAHLLNGEGRVVAQRDNMPLSGQAPTSTWVKGEIIADTYEIPLGKDVVAGEYRVEIGMYNAMDGKRLPVWDAEGNRLPDDRILLEETITVHF
ncbi:MAG: glycosyltransferase family 39 protein [Anaerolineae bacterium]